MQLEIWHNLAWSRYKGAVFTALARQAPARGADVEIVQIALTDGRRAALSDVAQARFDYPHEILFRQSYDDISRWRLLRRVWRRAWSSAADLTIIAGVDCPEYWLQALILTLRGRKRAVFFDSTRFDRPQRPWRNLAKRLFFRLVPWTLSYGERARDYAISLGVRPERALQRVQAAYLPPEYDEHDIAERRAPQPGRFLFVGRLAPEKGLDTLVEAFARYAAGDIGAHLRIVGAGQEEARLRTLARRHGMDGRIAFVGPLQDDALVQEYLAANALVLPSRSEPWGLVVNEALHYGCPVIVSDRCGCVPELVAGSDCGIVVPHGDAAALEQALRTARTRFDEPVSTAQRCLLAVAPFSSEKAAAQILDAAERILGKD